ncbi:hypothetical protein [Arsukibacterium sp.]|uniref:hypothetical protein n=1 Tax=Arsukibacterium sp. TaxID=1977258 RepID=UPI00356264FC
MYKWIITTILLCCSFAASANTCFDSLNKGSSACVAYHYDTLTVYFKDANNVEHKALVKRVIQKSDGILIHADYDFVARCTSQCSASNNIVNDVLWAFRNANINNSFYQKVVYMCDPTVEECCDDTGCNEIYGTESPTDGEQASSHKLKTDGQWEVTPLNGKKTRNGDIIDKALNRTEAITNIADNVLRNTSNGQQVQTDLSQVVAQPMLFTIINTPSGGVAVCASSGNYCNMLSGSATASENMAYFDLSHNNGQNFNEALRGFLLSNYQQDNGMICNTSTSCSSNGDSCTIHMTCRKY